MTDNVLKALLFGAQTGPRRHEISHSSGDLIQKNQPIGLVLLFRSLAPLRANALEPAAR